MNDRYWELLRRSAEARGRLAVEQLTPEPDEYWAPEAPEDACEGCS